MERSDDRSSGGALSCVDNDGVGPGATTVITIFSPSAERLARLTQRLPSDVGIVPCETWALARVVAPHTQCLVLQEMPRVAYGTAGLVEEGGSGAESRSPFRQHSPGCMVLPLPPVIVLGKSCTVSSLRVAFIPPAREPLLWMEIQRLLLATTLDDLRHLVSGIAQDSLRRRVLFRLLAPGAPVRSLQWLASRSGVSRQTLWRTARDWCDDGAAHLHDILGLTLTARILLEWYSSGCWTAAARRTGMNRHTTSELRRRYLGRADSAALGDHSDLRSRLQSSFETIAQARVRTRELPRRASDW